MVDVYCEESWENAKYIYVFAGQEEPEDYEEYGGASGEPRHIFGFSMMKDLDKRPDIAPNIYEIDWYGAMIVFCGHYTVTVLAMDENYHSYLYKEYPELYGGINGGIGIFGSASRYQYHLFITE